MQANASHDCEEASPGLATRHHWSVYALTSRLNHPCRPNAAIDTTWTNGTIGYEKLPVTVHRPRITVRVLNRIEQGDEITLDYHGHVPNNFDSTATRQTALNATYGFICVCPSCRNVPLSDTGRLTVRQHLATAAFANSTSFRHRNLSLPANARVVCSDALRRLVRDFLCNVQEEGIKDLRLANA